MKGVSSGARLQTVAMAAAVTGARRAAQSGEPLFNDQSSRVTRGRTMSARSRQAVAVARENTRPAAWLDDT